MKEAVTAFAGQHLYGKLLHTQPDHESDGAAAGRLHGAMASTQRPSSSELQVVLRSGIAAFLQAVAHEERELQQLSAACRAHKSFSAPELCDRARVYALLPQIPLRSWAGVHRFNNCFVRCPFPIIDAAENAGRRGKRKAGDASSASRPPPSATTPTAVVPTALVRSADVEVQLRKYWKLHDEAAARARLEALRSHDAEAFAEHVSLLKVSALLEIMERTEAFMRRIGLRLESQAANTYNNTLTQQQSEQRDGERGGCVSKAAAATTASSRRGDDDYARFRAYVASTKNEFKLMHRVDAFVVAQPSGLLATLLPHQMDGLRFLVSLHANHINGILADEMGVGKTLQTLAFLLHLKEQKKSSTVVEERRPHLVLAPLSVVREWREACEQFVTDSFRVALFQELADPVTEADAYDLVLMPVHAVRHAGATAARVQWGYVIVDEAHKAVANLQTVTANAIVSLPCARRLVLTGTPLSSDLQELWSLLHFLNPHVFSDNDAFEQVFRRPFQVYEAKEVELTAEERGLLVLRLHQVLRPFLLRRTKADIDASLRMTFHRVVCPLSQVQQRVLGMLRKERRAPAVMQQASSESDVEDDTEDEENDDASETNAAGVAAPAVMSGEGMCPATVPLPSAPPGALSRLIARHLPGLAASVAASQLQRRVRADRALCLSSANVSESVAQQVCNHAFLLPFFPQLLHRYELDSAVHEGRAAADDTHGESAAAGAAAAMALSCSGKFLLLHLLLSRLVVAGRKAVLFTHWLSCVDLVLDYLESRGWQQHAEVLTGSSTEEERKASVRRFRDDPTCLFFVLSIKAGGCGINLQAAHMVVLLDRDYTATNEDQALARVYRIGQRHTVRALYLVTDDPSEHRVAERAEEKNRPRRAIIDGGTYQVTGRAAVEEEQKEEQQEEESLSGLAEKDAGGATTADISTAELWATLWVAKCASQEDALAPPRSAESRPNERDDAATCRQFWTLLRQLVCSLDELVLTDEDKGETAAREGDAEVRTFFPSASGAGQPSTAGTAHSALTRLRSTLPPESLTLLEQELCRSAAEEVSNTETQQSSAAPRSLAPELPHTSFTSFEGAAAAAAPTHTEEVDAAFASSSGVDVQVPAALNDCSSKSPCTLAELPPPPPSPTDPLRCPALFWAEFAFLLHCARDGHSLICAALDTAVANDTRGEDPAEQLLRRQRRDRRAAKRMRLATVEVPDAFREKCYEAGVEEGEEEAVAEAYLRHLDARAAKAKKRRAADA